MHVFDEGQDLEVGHELDRGLDLNLDFPQLVPTEEQWVEVAVDAPIAGVLTYLAPSDLHLQRGDLVQVQLGKRAASGVVLGHPKERPNFISKSGKSIDIKPVLGRSPDGRLSESRLQWLEWLSQYYGHPIGQTLGLAFPPLPREGARSRQKKTSAVPTNLNVASPGPILTEEQAQVVGAIRSFSQHFSAHLIHGVTGSGKTEIYIQLFEDLIRRNQQGLLLVPEIALTPQLIQRFVGRLGNAVAVMHSGLTPREKTNQWYDMLDRKKSVLIGARSALFCPLPELGLIVLDEEHEPSFKQDEKLRYHARDAAVKLASLAPCPVVFGSATPSLETWNNVLHGRYNLHTLKSRVQDRPMPEVEIVDLRTSRSEKRETPELCPDWMSSALYSELQVTLNRGEQAALFINRRGMAQSVICQSCGHHFECPNCSVSLSLHGKTSLVCHYCNYYITLPEVCPTCLHGEPKALGAGTELVENDLKKLFPSARLVRMDRDEIQTREDLQGAIDQMENREADILIGTQMIAKGLDFPGLTLVGVLLADIALNLPDFRASERGFHLLTQVAGRAGRHLSCGRAGKVIIQTYNPDHPSLIYSVNHDFIGFARYELEQRQVLGYPPFQRLAMLRLMGQNQDRVVRMAKLLRSRAEKLKQFQVYQGIELLGPAPAPMTKLRNQYRWQLLAKGPNPTRLSAFCRQLIAKTDWLTPGVRVVIDMDAINLM